MTGLQPISWAWIPMGSSTALDSPGTEETHEDWPSAPRESASKGGENWASIRVCLPLIIAWVEITTHPKMDDLLFKMTICGLICSQFVLPMHTYPLSLWNPLDNPFPGNPIPCCVLIVLDIVALRVDGWFPMLQHYSMSQHHVVFVACLHMPLQPGELYMGQPEDSVLQNRTLEIIASILELP